MKDRLLTRDGAFCFNCEKTYSNMGMAFLWFYADGRKGVCIECHKGFRELGYTIVEELLLTKYKDFSEDHNLYFRVWSYMWSKEVIEGFWGWRYSTLNPEEPDFHYAPCLAWEMVLYFRNWGAELDILLRSKEDEIKEDLMRRQKELLGVYALYSNLRR